MSHLRHLWIKNPHVRKPFARALGTVKRRGKLGSSVVANRLELRTSLFLCASCEYKMPAGWRKKYEYRLLPDMHGDHVRCDACQGVGPANIYHPEGPGTYTDEYQRLARIEQAATAQPFQVRDHRRIRGL
jgi:hypothetical protein